MELALSLLNMNDQSRSGMLEVPIFRGAIWLIASLAGLWFVFRGADPTQIGENLYLNYFGYAAAIFLAFEWGRVFGGLYNEWWANHIQVFISVAIPTFALWIIWGAEATPPFSDSVTRSNTAATLFVGWLIPALYGAHSRQRFGRKREKQELQTMQILTGANNIVNRYGAFMRSSAFPAPGCVADTKKLPYEKEAIKVAFVLLMKLCNDPEKKEFLKYSYVSLANFQDGVGETDLGLDLQKLPNVKDIDSMTGRRWQQLIKAAHAMTHSADKFKEKVEQERLVLEKDVAEI